MDEYVVELKRSAQKELERLRSSVMERMVAKLEKLATNPRPDGCKKLKGGDREYRVQVGEYRAVYLIDEPNRLDCDTHSTPELGLRVVDCTGSGPTSPSLRLE